MHGAGLCGSRPLTGAEGSGTGGGAAGFGIRAPVVLGGLVPLNALAGWRPERQGRSELSLG